MQELPDLKSKTLRYTATFQEFFHSISQIRKTEINLCLSM